MGHDEEEEEEALHFKGKMKHNEYYQEETKWRGNVFSVEAELAWSLHELCPDESVWNGECKFVNLYSK